MKTNILVVTRLLKNVQFEFEELWLILREKQLVVSARLLNNEGYIETPHCYIRMCYFGDSTRYRGYRCDICFGYLSIGDQRYLNKSGKPTDYKGSCLDYVLEIENIKEKNNGINDDCEG